MDNLYKILTSITPEREYRIKFAFEPSAQQLSLVQARLNDRYDATEISPLQKTIFQANPIDFPELDCGEIWFFDFKCTRPVSEHVLRYEIGAMLQVIEQYVVVRSALNPLEIEQEKEDIDFDEYIPKITDSDFSDSLDFDVTLYAGQEQVDNAVQAAVTKLEKEPSAYAKYMAAGYKKD